MKINVSTLHANLTVHTKHIFIKKLNTVNNMHDLKMRTKHTVPKITFEILLKTTNFTCKIPFYLRL